MTIEYMYYLCISSTIATDMARRILVSDRTPASDVFQVIFYFSSFICLILVWAIPVAAIYKFGWVDGVILTVVSIFSSGFLGPIIIRKIHAYSIILVAIVGVANSTIIGISFMTPKTYAECVLDNMPSAKTNIAANEIRRACYSKYWVAKD